MLSEEITKALVGRQELTQEETLLICLATYSIQRKSVAEIRRLATQAGLIRAWSWNVSSVLGKSRGRAIRRASGWQLTALGWETVRGLAERHLRETVWSRQRHGASLSAGA